MYLHPQCTSQMLREQHFSFHHSSRICKSWVWKTLAVMEFRDNSPRYSMRAACLGPGKEGT